ncbi:hypothetical protein K502DRAFT_368539 [Neoconidiobolus thromboides FSU 785]|nr:hypothetical protein K502DRAFT_368539 [Neoconidiobolus thromboides FSU 785]
MTADIISDTPIEVESKPEVKEKNLLDDIKSALQLLEKGVNSVETRFISRALRGIPTIRKELNKELLANSIVKFFPEDNLRGTTLLNLLDSKREENGGENTHSTILPEAELYLSLLVQLFLLDNQQIEKCTYLSDELVKHIQVLNRRSCDKLAAKIYFYFAQVYEKQGKLESIRSVLLAAQRSSSLRLDDESQATIINILIRSYFFSNLYDQADKLISKTTFPEDVSNNQYIRYMYYVGRIKALQLDYTSAYQHLLQAVRKAPHNAPAAGFLQTAYKLYLIIQLLMGELPDREMFQIPYLKKSLLPYLEITQAVRIGDLTKFQEALTKYSNIYQKDKNYNLILRLRHNVIKTGIRMISLSYSKISLRDICFKLQLDSEQDAEYIVAKSIRDGVIDAVINHEEGYVESKENVDVYSSSEPMNAFHQRISFCLNLHNESVKAMRFPDNFYNPEIDSFENLYDRDRDYFKDIVDDDLGDEDSNMEF